MRYLEDLRAGETVDLGTIAVDRDEVVAFARRYDPQGIHVDDAAAAAGPFGGIIASGWHTGAMWQRRFVDGFAGTVANLGGMGFEDTRFLLPVRPGDELRATVEVLEVRGSQRRPDRGTVTLRGALHGPDGRAVFMMRMQVRVARRPVADQPQ